MKKGSRTSRTIYGRKSVNLTTLTTVPTPTSSDTITMTTDGRYFSVSGSIDLKAGDWIFDPAQNSDEGEVRMILSVIDENSGYLSEGFSADLTADTFYYITSEQIDGIWAMDFIMQGESDPTTVDGIPLEPASTYRVGLPIPPEGDLRYPIQPVVVDASSGKDCDCVINRLTTFSSPS